MADAGSACNAEWFAEAAGGSLVKGTNQTFVRVDTDSRHCLPASLFVAVKGENSDGHNFASQAADSGATVLLVSNKWWQKTGKKELEKTKASVIAVDDTVKALQQAATAYRRLFPDLVRIAVTGSSGKTTTKELLASIFSISNNTVKNPGNLNSDIGLPVSIFNIKKENKIAIFELGINYPGEMDILASVFEPDCALITNIGSAHIGVLGGSRSKIALEKGKICSNFNGSQTLIIYEDDDFKDILFANLNGRTETYGYKSLKGLEYTKDMGLEGWYIKYFGTEIKLHLAGKHNLLNAFAAIKTASLYDVSPEDIAKGIALVHPLEGRSRILKGSFVLFDDCYNSNAESAEAALALCASVKIEGKRIFVLGSMKELGEESIKSHQGLGRSAALYGADILAFYGDEAKEAYNSAIAASNTEVTSARPAQIVHFSDYSSLESFILSSVKDKDLVLIKASRTMALERLVSQLVESGGLHVS